MTQKGKQAHKWRDRSHKVRLGILLLSIFLFLAAWAAFGVSWLTNSHAAITASAFTIALFGTKGLFWGIFIYSGWRIVEWWRERGQKPEEDA